MDDRYSVGSAFLYDDDQRYTVIVIIIEPFVAQSRHKVKYIYDSCNTTEELLNLTGKVLYVPHDVLKRALKLW